MFEIISATLFIIIVFLSIKLYRLSTDIKSLSSALINEYSRDKSEDELVQEQFLKFVSDSREWAFEYIENVQSVISSLSNILEEIVSKYTQEDIESDNDKAMIIEINKELKKILPEQDN